MDDNVLSIPNAIVSQIPANNYCRDKANCPFLGWQTKAITAVCSHFGGLDLDIEEEGGKYYVKRLEICKQEFPYGGEVVTKAKRKL